jgi:hypothetical protein
VLLASFVVGAFVACSSYSTNEPGPSPDGGATDGGDAGSGEGGPPPVDGGSDAGDAGVDGSSAYAAAVLADHPLFYLRLGESAGISAVDTAGGNDGVYGGAPYALGHVGLLTNDPDTSLVLDGGNGHAAVQPIGNLSGALTAFAPFTIEAWILETARPGTSRWILGREDLGPPRNGISFLVDDTGVYLERWVKQNASRVGGPANPDVGVPAHVVATFDGATMQVWVDGIAGSSGPSEPDASVPANAQPLAIGSQSSFLTAGFLGVLDEVALYDHVLAPERIATHYKIGSGKGGN